MCVDDDVQDQTGGAFGGKGDESVLILSLKCNSYRV